MSAIAGHLVIEALMVELIRLKSEADTAWRMNFMQKVDHCIKHDSLRPRTRRAFEMFNDIRNDYAHCLGEYKTQEDMWALALECLRNVEGQDTAKVTPENLGKTREQMLEWAVESLYYELAEALADRGDVSFMPY